MLDPFIIATIMGEPQESHEPIIPKLASSGKMSPHLMQSREQGMLVAAAP